MVVVFAHKQIGPYNLVDTIIVYKLEKFKFGLWPSHDKLWPIIVMFEMIRKMGNI